MKHLSFMTRMLLTTNLFGLSILLISLGYLHWQGIEQSGVLLTVTMLSLLVVNSIVMASLISSRLNQPIQRNISQLEKMEQHLNLRLDHDRDDELGALFKAVNRHADTQQQIIQEVITTSDDLTVAVEQLISNGSQSTELARSQQSETDTVASASAEMAASSNEMAGHAQSTLEAAAEASHQTDTGLKVVTQTISSISGLAQRMEGLQSSVKRLDDGSQNIGKVIDTIAGIADQTNLLALNAAIEAARAGEHGRGFAVVADEVRQLASNTQQATQEIHRIISELQASSRTVTTEIEQGSAQALNCVEQSNIAGEALQKISRSVMSVNDMGQQIATAAREQSQVTEEVSRSMTRINSMAEENTQAMSLNQEVSSALSQRARQLEQLISRFRTGMSNRSSALEFGKQDIESLSASELDKLAYGAIELDRYGKIRRYNSAEGDITGRNPREVIGKDFFKDVAPCTNTPEFKGTFDRGVKSGNLNTSFEYIFDYKMKPTKVKVQMKKALGGDSYWILVKRVG